jgi:hypothetical protein
MPDTLGTSASGRWWEYYALRYFVGTVVGVLAVVFLARFPESPFYASPILSFDNLDKAGISEIAGLAALGFAYCYIASAPILLLHATRGQLGLNPLKLRRRFWCIAMSFVATFQAAAIWWLAMPLISIRSLGALVFLVVVVAQIATIFAAHHDRFNAIKSFYVELAKARGRKDPVVAEYVESYRHLREHGNSLGIIALELALALVVVSAQQPLLAVLALTLWLLPAAYSWFVGSLLEAGSEWRKTDCPDVPPQQTTAQRRSGSTDGGHCIVENRSEE